MIRLNERVLHLYEKRSILQMFFSRMIASAEKFMHLNFLAGEESPNTKLVTSY